jgi:hypothetical protein
VVKASGVASDPGSPSVEERLFSLVHRELGADEVSVTTEPGIDEPGRLAVPLIDERWVVARFNEPPEDRDAMLRRMAILVSAFSHLFERETKKPSSRVPPAQSLIGELTALTNRARAMDAIVVDAHSPVVWGSSRGFRQQPSEISEELADVLRLVELTRCEIIQLVRDELVEAPTSNAEPARLSEPPPPEEAAATAAQSDDATATAITAHALGMVRALPEFSELRRGRPLRARYRSGELGYVAHSFAGIYLLLLVFDGEFDEIRAERAIHDAQSRIERLVLALPPRDPSPTPMGNVIRLPRRR